MDVYSQSVLDDPDTRFHVQVCGTPVMAHEIWYSYSVVDRHFGEQLG